MPRLAGNGDAHTNGGSHSFRYLYGTELKLISASLIGLLEYAMHETR